MYAYTCIHIRVDVHFHIRIPIYTYVHIYTHTLIPKHTRARATHARTHTCTHVHTRTHAHTQHTHTYTHTHTYRTAPHHTTPHESDVITLNMSDLLGSSDIIHHHRGFIWINVYGSLLIVLLSCMHPTCET